MDKYFFKSRKSLTKISYESMNKYWYEGFEFISVSSVGQSRETFTMKSSVDFQSICLLNGISSLLLLYFNCNIFSASSGHNVHHHNCQFSLALVCSLCGFNDDIYVSVQPLCCWRILGFFLTFYLTNILFPCLGVLLLLSPCLPEIYPHGLIPEILVH